MICLSSPLNPMYAAPSASTLKKRASGNLRLFDLAMLRLAALASSVHISTVTPLYYTYAKLIEGEGT